MSTFIQARIGPSFGGEVDAAGLSGLPFSWSSNGVAADASFPADKLAPLKAVIAAHDPTKLGPQTGPVPSCSRLGLVRALKEENLWSTVRFMLSQNPDMQEEWDLATELRISDPMIKEAVAGLAQQGIALSDADVQALVTRANELVA